VERALSDWPVWLQALGAAVLVAAVGVLTAPGWALLAAGLLVLVVGVMAEAAGARVDPRRVAANRLRTEYPSEAAAWAFYEARISEALKPKPARAKPRADRAKAAR